MALGYSPNRTAALDDLLARHGGELLRVALESIGHGLAHGARLGVDPAGYPRALRTQHASFVTLKVEGDLRGCIGRSRPCNPLVADVAENAYAAAFEDDRFASLTADEVDGVDIKVSVLGEPEPLRFGGESELLSMLRPGVDGVILECGTLRALFLPDVWQMLPEPRDFLAHLKVKAGLEPDYWSPEIAAERFATASTSLSAPTDTA
jgi:AmmeMemoRadiSam system protein A